MAEDTTHWCVLLPCSATENWAVPQKCLAEIVTLHGSAAQPPEELEWRGETVPVLDFGCDDGRQWREHLGGTGLVAVFLGLEGEDCDYWAVAVRGEGLAVRQLRGTELGDASRERLEHASGAFRLQGVLYQVPDMLQLQRKIATTAEVA